MIHVKGFPTICETFGGWLQLLPDSKIFLFRHLNAIELKAPLRPSAPKAPWIYLFSNFSATQDSWDVLKEFWIYPEFFGPFSQPLRVISNVISLSFLSKKTFIVHCFLVSLIRNQYKWCFKYLQVVFDKAMAIYAQLFHLRQQLRLLENSSNLVGQNPEMRNATMQNLHKKKTHQNSLSHLFLA